jgi:hypothetical protein
MNTAGATGYGYRYDTATDAYAIPINHALAIVRQITSGKASATVHVGATAFIGVAQTGASHTTTVTLAGGPPQ